MKLPSVADTETTLALAPHRLGEQLQTCRFICSITIIMPQQQRKHPLKLILAPFRRSSGTCSVARLMLVRAL